MSMTFDLDTARDANGVLVSAVPGDVVVFFGRPHQVDRVEEIPTPAQWLRGELGAFHNPTYHVLRAADGWGIGVFGWEGR